MSASALLLIIFNQLILFHQMELGREQGAVRRGRHSGHQRGQLLLHEEERQERVQDTVQRRSAAQRWPLEADSHQEVPLRRIQSQDEVLTDRTAKFCI